MRMSWEPGRETLDLLVRQAGKTYWARTPGFFLFFLQAASCRSGEQALALAPLPMHLATKNLGFYFFKLHGDATP